MTHVRAFTSSRSPSPVVDLSTRGKGGWDGGLLLRVLWLIREGSQGGSLHRGDYVWDRYLLCFLSLTVTDGYRRGQHRQRRRHVQER